MTINKQYRVSRASDVRVLTRLLSDKKNCKTCVVLEEKGATGQSNVLRREGLAPVENAAFRHQMTCLPHSPHSANKETPLYHSFEQFSISLVFQTALFTANSHMSIPLRFTLFSTRTLRCFSFNANRCMNPSRKLCETL